MTVKPYTNQEAFDKAVLHLMTMDSPARDDNEKCLYRTEDGKRCAVGCLIEDEDYDPGWENEPAGLLLNKDNCPEYLKGLFPNLLDNLQEVHDNTSEYGVDNWTQLPMSLLNPLRKVAKKHKLSFKEKRFVKAYEEHRKVY